MSLINKMLQDLDERHAAPGAASARSGALAQHVRPVKSRRFSELFWVAMALLMLGAVGWTGWVIWQMMPRPVVTDLAYQTGRVRAPVVADSGTVAAKSNAAPALPKSPVDAKTATDLAMSAAVTTASAAPAAVPPAAVPSKKVSSAADTKVDMLRLATELTTPVTRAPARSHAATGPKAAGKSRKDVRAVAAVQSGSAGPAPSAPEPGRIDRRASSNPREQSDSEYRRAVSLVNQGRVAEGMDGLRTALRTDPGNEVVRQTLVALLLEARQIDEAGSVLQQGLELNSSNAGFAMLMARVMVERGDVTGALALLQKHAAGNESADYHAFVGALLQRLGRHDEAVGEYQAALRRTPAAGVWWVGLGISQQALNRTKDASDSFRRAKASGNLAPDLVSFADERLKLLR